MANRLDSYCCKHCGKAVPPEGIYCKHCGLPLGTTFREITGERRKGRNTDLLTGPERYRVEAVIADTDYAQAALARDFRLGRQVLIRRPSAAFRASEEGLSAFLRSVRTAARLRHPGIVAVFEEGVDRDGPYAVTEYIEGRTLGAMLATDGRLGLQQVLRLGVDIAEALSYAHGQGVVHGSLTPDRIVVDPQGRPRIVSFVRIECPECPLRRSPYDAEDMNLLQPRAADDLYALGMVLRAALLGAPGPLEGATIPVSLRDILAKALAPQASSRWASAEEFRDVLDAVGGRRLKARDGRCPDCGGLDLCDNTFCGNCGSDLRDLFRTCDVCAHRQHQRHPVCGQCGAHFGTQGRIALEQVFLALLAGAWDSVAKEIRRLRSLSIELEPLDAEQGARVLEQVATRLSRLWQEADWTTIQVALPLADEVARTLGILTPPELRRLAHELSSCTRLVAEAEEMARDRMLTEARAKLDLCARAAPRLPVHAETLRQWLAAMLQWVDERIMDADRLRSEGRIEASRLQLQTALQRVHPRDPAAMRALRLLERLVSIGPSSGSYSAPSSAPSSAEFRP